MYLNSNGIPDTHAHPHQIDIHSKEVEIRFSTRQLLSLTKVIESLSPSEPDKKPLEISNAIDGTLYISADSNCTKAAPDPLMNKIKQITPESSEESEEKPKNAREEAPQGGGWSGWLWDVLLIDNEELSSDAEDDYYYENYQPGLLD